MKKLNLSILIIFAFGTIVLFQHCDNNGDESAKDRTLKILQSKNWTVSSVVVPTNTATQDTDWVNFTVSFTATNMTASGHPTGAQAVWPSGTYSVSDDGNVITRGDGVLMTLNPISDTNFTSIFSVPAGTEIGGRLAALDGEYRFNMK